MSDTDAVRRGIPGRVAGSPHLSRSMDLLCQEGDSGLPGTEARTPPSCPPVAWYEVDVDVHDVLPCGLPGVDADVVAVGVVFALTDPPAVIDETGKRHPLFVRRLEVIRHVPGAGGRD